MPPGPKADRLKDARVEPALVKRDDLNLRRGGRRRSEGGLVSGLRAALRRLEWGREGNALLLLQGQDDEGNEQNDRRSPNRLYECHQHVHAGSLSSDSLRPSWGRETAGRFLPSTRLCRTRTRCPALASRAGAFRFESTQTKRKKVNPPGRGRGRWSGRSTITGLSGAPTPSGRAWWDERAGCGPHEKRGRERKRSNGRSEQRVQPIEPDDALRAVWRTVYGHPGEYSVAALPALRLRGSRAAQGLLGHCVPAQNGFCTRPVAHQRHDLASARPPLQGSFGPRSCTSPAVSRLNIHPPNRCCGACQA
ncbi:hypothetical protein GGP72_002798 [Salinibacter ruber]|uniref:Uncharacterized protein n=1 Tax=Salinibacter ruber TaxID=146919 RepID=A0A9X2Q3P3_9BACT|nr:hypothetical protein [Salinibacter ruber]MCS3682143.1 hypothetical protein [Salinibacter ruber]